MLWIQGTVGVGVVQRQCPSFCTRFSMSGEINGCRYEIKRWGAGSFSVWGTIAPLNNACITSLKCLVAYWCMQEENEFSTRQWLRGVVCSPFSPMALYSSTLQNRRACLSNINCTKMLLFKLACRMKKICCEVWPGSLPLSSNQLYVSYYGRHKSLISVTFSSSIMVRRYVRNN